jgi:hypothetical protein
MGHLEVMGRMADQVARRYSGRPGNGPEVGELKLEDGGANRVEAEVRRAGINAREAEKWRERRGAVLVQVADEVGRLRKLERRLSRRPDAGWDHRAVVA